MRKPPEKSGLRVSILLLCFLPIAGCGVLMGYLLIAPLLEWHQMKNWKEVDARILGTQLDVRQNDGSTSYEIRAKYVYDYGGQTYENNRVTLLAASDISRSFHEQAYDKLHRRAQTGMPVPCFVDPKDPSNSVLYRKMQGKMLNFYMWSCLLFVVACLGVLFSMLWLVLKWSDENRRQKAHPQSPWLWKPDWAAGKIRSSNRAIMFGMLLGATLVNLFALSYWFGISSELDEEQNLGIKLLVPVICTGMSLAAGFFVLRWWRFGESVFQMAMTPGVLGRPLVGVIRNRVNLQPRNGFMLTLCCIRTLERNTGKSTSMSEKILFQESQTVTRQLAAESASVSAIPVDFQIPYDLPESTAMDKAVFMGSRTKISWQLTVTAAMPAMNYSAKFDIPVFKTKESSPEVR